MRRSVARLLGLGAALAVTAGSAAVAQAKTINVGPGDSIQAAVDQAKAGDVVKLAAGTYHQNVTITTDGITLTGAGPGMKGTKLRPAATPTPSPCNDPTTGEVNGICIVGGVDSNGNPTGSAVSGTTVSNLSVRGFSGFGVFLFHADDSTIRRVAAVRNGGYGISGFVMHGVRFLSNYAAHNGAPGFYVGDSPDAQAVILGNTAVANTASGVEGIGFLFRDSSHGSVHGNWARGNCAGFVFVDTAENPDPATAWRASGNHADRNSASCTAEEGGGAPALSGIGIALVGVQGTNLSGNEASHNAATGESFASGGIVVASGVPLGGADLKNVVVARNSAHDNSPFDILWDQSGTHVRFVDNDCGSSSPDWICSS